MKDFALTTQKLLGNNIGAAGKLNELVESSTGL
jgi:hypothetical protein